jgi:carbonic anhydrase
MEVSVKYFVALAIKLEVGLTSEATIRGANWDDEYVLAKGELYWSLDNNHGAQHAIDGQTYAMELQLVHYNKNSGDLEKAAAKEGGLIITSLLFEVK